MSAILEAVEEEMKGLKDGFMKVRTVGLGGHVNSYHTDTASPATPRARGVMT